MLGNTGSMLLMRVRLCQPISFGFLRRVLWTTAVTDKWEPERQGRRQQLLRLGGGQAGCRRKSAKLPTGLGGRRDRSAQPLVLCSHIVDHSSTFCTLILVILGSIRPSNYAICKVLTMNMKICHTDPPFKITSIK